MDHGAALASECGQLQDRPEAQEMIEVIVLVALAAVVHVFFRAEMLRALWLSGVPPPLEMLFGRAHVMRYIGYFMVGSIVLAGHLIKPWNVLSILLLGHGLLIVGLVTWRRESAEVKAAATEQIEPK